MLARLIGKKAVGRESNINPIRWIARLRKSPRLPCPIRANLVAKAIIPLILSHKAISGFRMSRYFRRMTHVLRLHYAPDNASLIIRITLEELGVPYDCVLVDRANSAQRAPDYLALNPNGLIPTLETPDGPIFETGAILLWLADRHAALAPAPDTPDRAGFLKWLFFVANTLHPALRMLFYPEKYVGPDAAAQDTLGSINRAALAGHLHKLDAAASDIPRWLGADQPSILDIYVAACLRWMALYPVAADKSWFDLTAYPALYQLAISLESRASVRAAQAAEGLGPTPFTAPHYATPPEGSAT